MDNFGRMGRTLHKRPSRSLLFDSFWGQFPEYQISANDNYYNHYIYGAWQHQGMSMGNPLLPGPVYNADHSISFRSNRVRAHHLGISGQPSSEWGYRMLISFARHWGTYGNPLDQQRKQFNSLYEATYTPKWAKGWSASAALGLDRGNYLGNSTGGMLTIRKNWSDFLIKEKKYETNFLYRALHGNAGHCM